MQILQEWRGEEENSASRYEVNNEHKALVRIQYFFCWHPDPILECKFVVDLDVDVNYLV
jgi:hypothetical protein